MKPDPAAPTIIALAGNPNCGKTTLFNALTGARQQVGNWPGVTVERKEGAYTHAGRTVTVVDLPGIYSFAASSPDEIVARDYVLRARPALVVNILDASNLERNLYLTTQLLEMHVPLIVALNMSDVAQQRGVAIEVEHLARHLGCQVIPLVANRGEGLEALRNAINQSLAVPTVSAARVEYDSEVEKALRRLQPELAEAAAHAAVDPRWLALKRLEGDPLAAELAGAAGAATAAAEAARVARHVGEEMDLVLADGRYGFIHGLAHDVINRRDQVRRTVTDVVDRLLLNRVLGLPLLFAVMYGVFAVTVRCGQPFIACFDRLAGTLLVDGLGAWLSACGAPDWLRALLADGLGGGIQTVATFVPPIFLIFLCLAILEDSGYMARAAFLMDRLLRVIGLPGRAFLPMLLGFGCNVPAILAARTLEHARERTLTILMNPFMSCGARLPVYTLFAVAFFPRYGGTAVFLLYATGIVLAVLTGFVLHRTLLRGPSATFVMELPPYHLPTARAILFHAWERLKSFIWRAGQVILLVVVVLRLLTAIGTDGRLTQAHPERSILSAVGRAVTPLFAPLGITRENWPATVGLFSGLFAKEAIVGSLNALYTQYEPAGAPAPLAPPAFSLAAGLREALRAVPEGFGLLPAASGSADADTASLTPALHRHFDWASAIAYLLFVLIYAPCAATVAAIQREAGTRWALFSVSYQTLLAWIVATGFYQLATFTAHPATSTGWLTICAIGLASGYAALRALAPRQG